MHDASTAAAALDVACAAIVVWSLTWFFVRAIRATAFPDEDAERDGEASE